MRITTAGVAARRPLRSHLDDPVGLRRGELAAGLATAAIAGQLLFAQVTLLTAVALIVLGRVSRWRPHWLAALALASLVWILAVGPARAAAAFVVGSRRLADYLLAAAIHPALLAHPGVVAVGAAAWLPTELPVTLVAACGEAGLVLWLGWWRQGASPRFQSQSPWRWRAGVVAVVRRHVSAAALAAGRTVTSDGCAVGLSMDTGKLATLSWAEVLHGLLLAGQDVDLVGLAVACAALRRRKTVLILEYAGRPGGVTGHVRELGASLGIPVPDASGAAVAGSRGTAVTTAADVVPGSRGTTVASASAAPGGGTDAGSVAEVIGRAIRRRETVLIATSRDDYAQRTADGLAAVLTGLRDLGLRADCLAWISGCEFMDAGSLSALLALGPLTGTAMVVSTTSASHAAALAPAAALVAVSGPVNADFAAALAANAGGKLFAPTTIGRQSGSHAPLRASDPPSRPTESAGKISTDAADRAITDILTAQRGGEFTMLAVKPLDGRPARLTTSCRAVPIALGRRQ
jgi:hypothetical protein